MARIIKDESELDAALADVRKQGKLVFTNGCFDLLHPGHTRSLIRARELGGSLVIGLNSDESVKNLKGLRRPVLPLAARAELLAALACVDLVIPFDEDTPEKLIKRVKPDILVKGGDYQDKEIVGADFVKANGGEVQTMSYEAGWSTSTILEDLVHKFTHPTEEEDTPPFGTKLD